MREILFRAKKTGTLEWVEGFVASPFEDTMCLFVEQSTGTKWFVDDHTVGQYTGLTDKNGKKIFEGDILSIAQIMDGIGKYNFPPLKYPVNVVVIWDKCAWGWKTICKDKRHIHFPDAWCHFECEVIGNIHDNPELIKGGAE